MPQNYFSFNAPPDGVFDIPLTHKVYGLYKNFQEFSKLFPKSEKHTLGQKIENLILEILENGFLAADSPKQEKIPLLKTMSVKTHLLKTLLRLTLEIRIMDNKKYIILQEQLQEVGKMIGGWLRYLQRQ